MEAHFCQFDERKNIMRNFLKIVTKYFKIMT